MLLLVAGLPGTGKTTIARAFSALSGAVHLNSDVLRREMGLMGHYAPEDKQKVYVSLLQKTRESLEAGQTVVVDSTFYKESVRAPFRELALQCGTPLRWVEIKADEKVLQERLSHPRADSEADFSVYEKIRDQFEPLPEERLVLFSDVHAPDSAALLIQQYLAA